jgi:hypothetical protein
MMKTEGETTNLNNQGTSHNSNPSAKPSKIQLLDIARMWHIRINEELKTPILPDNLEPEVLDEKLRNISRQREKHKLYSRVLDKLIRTSKLKGSD